MDLYCKFCGEPCDMDEFHNGTDTFRQIARLYQQYGCPIAEQAMDGIPAHEMTRTACDNEPIVTDDRLIEIEAAYEVNGDDVDGSASMLGD